jgi:hypothetical protein
MAACGFFMLAWHFRGPMRDGSIAKARNGPTAQRLLPASHCFMSTAIPSPLLGLSTLSFGP